MDTNQSKSKRPDPSWNGLLVGVVIGVILSMVLDSWAWMGAGVGIGLVLSGMPLFGRRKDAGEESEQAGDR
ncbi:hypothetical protein [Ornithinimicrobium faecis]|uniref:Glycine zipper family protein n=1 Tax=Ornithinimicrobium faecis TaxID=2934158 RepID=A0ABY4YPH5_9MICO|nr:MULTISPECIES: hypothetical protein [unclassified Ornithinimicrobium]USQ78390.1 hypothetical protein NF556_12115 [Ornithinimicrobium sp. HY1793]